MKHLTAQVAKELAGMKFDNFVQHVSYWSTGHPNSKKKKDANPSASVESGLPNLTKYPAFYESLMEKASMSVEQLGNQFKQAPESYLFIPDVSNTRERIIESYCFQPKSIAGTFGFTRESARKKGLINATLGYAPVFKVSPLIEIFNAKIKGYKTYETGRYTGTIDSTGFVSLNKEYGSIDDTTYKTLCIPPESVPYLTTEVLYAHATPMTQGLVFDAAVPLGESAASTKIFAEGIAITQALDSLNSDLTRLCAKVLKEMTTAINIYDERNKFWVENKQALCNAITFTCTRLVDSVILVPVWQVTLTSGDFTYINYYCCGRWR